MMLSCIAPAIFIIILGIQIESLHGLADVVMTVSYEGFRDYMLNITFPSSSFSEFSQCLCDNQIANCTAVYKTANFEVKDVDSVKTQIDFMSDCRLYKCINSAQGSRLVCMWLGQQVTTCPVLVNPTFISVSHIKRCDTKCVGISWTLPEEFLTINNPQIESGNCSKDCCPTSSALVPQTVKSTTKFTSTVLISAVSYQETYIVSSVAAGIVFMALVLFIIAVFVQRRRESPAPLRENDQVPGRLPTNNWIGTNGYVNSVPNAGAKRQINQNDQSNRSAGYMIPNGARTPGNQRTLEDAHISLEKSEGNAINKKGKSWGLPFFSNAKSSKNESPSLDLYSAHVDEDYAVIDESQMQPGDPYRHSQNDNSDDIQLDGYSVLNNFGYFNVENAAASLEKSHTNPGDDGTRIISPNQLQERKDEAQRESPALTPFTNQFSEYSVAKPITEDTINDETDAHLGTGQTDQSASRSSGGHAPEGSPDSWPPAAHEHSSAVNDEPDRGSSIYFELEVEGEENV